MILKINIKFGERFSVNKVREAKELPGEYGLSSSEAVVDELKTFDCWVGIARRKNYLTSVFDKKGKYIGWEKRAMHYIRIPSDIAIFLGMKRRNNVEVALRVLPDKWPRPHPRHRSPLSKDNRLALFKSSTTAPGLLPGASLKAARIRTPKQISSFRATNDRRRSCVGKFAKACLSSERKSSITSRVRDDLSNLGTGNHNHSQKPYSLQKRVQALGTTDLGTTEAVLKSSKKDKGAEASTSAKAYDARPAMPCYDKCKGRKI